MTHKQLSRAERFNTGINNVVLRLFILNLAKELEDKRWQER